MTFLSDSPARTETIAAKLAATLHASACIALDGELGAGKTRFVRGLVRGLGADPAAVSSPTFVLLNVYDRGRLPVFHLDAYRVGPEDFEAIGFSELLAQRGIVVIEWASRVAELLPAERIDVRIDTVGKRRRRIEISRVKIKGEG